MGLEKRILDIENEIRLINERLFKIEQVMQEEFPNEFAGEAETIADPDLKPITLPRSELI